MLCQERIARRKELLDEGLRTVFRHSSYLIVKHEQPAGTSAAGNRQSMTIVHLPIRFSVLRVETTSPASAGKRGAIDAAARVLKAYGFSE